MKDFFSDLTHLHICHKFKKLHVWEGTNTAAEKLFWFPQGTIKRVMKLDPEVLFLSPYLYVQFLTCIYVRSTWSILRLYSWSARLQSNLLSVLPLRWDIFLFSLPITSKLSQASNFMGGRKTMVGR